VAGRARAGVIGRTSGGSGAADAPSGQVTTAEAGGGAMKMHAMTTGGGTNGSDGSDPRTAAREARLRYVCDDERGYTRRRHGRGFSYLDDEGTRVTDPEERARIESLVIPPAWQEVWICRDDRGHLQATGRDEAGRKQYLYHPRWREVRDRVKFEQLVTFAEVLPAIRRRIRRDLREAPLSRRRVIAAIVKLLDMTLVRVGNATYAKANGSFGLTTLRDEHAEANGDAIELSFAGKGGAHHELSVRDEELAAVVRECQEIEGHELFRYASDGGAVRTVDSGDVNAYLREASRHDVTAKHFRTWGATVLAARALHAAPAADSATARKRRVVAAVREVAADLGNTPAVCRRSYVHPQVLAGYLAGSFGAEYAAALDAARRSRPRELRLHEAATSRYLDAVASPSAVSSET
jgi:DNA topoisomerase I